MHGLRADAGLIKIFALRLPELVAQWQRVPFFSVPNAIYREYRGDEAALALPMNTPDKPLPYDAFVIHLDEVFDRRPGGPVLAELERCGGGEKGSIDVFVRIMAASIADARSVAKAVTRAPGMEPLYMLDAAFYVHGMGQIDGTQLLSICGGYHGSKPVHVASSVTCLTIDGSTRRLPDDQNTSYMCDLVHTGANNMVSYLMQSPKHLLSVRQAAPRVSAKTAAKKPWLRDDLPVLTLMGPDEALAAGQPRTAGGSIRPGPRPHARRGHWRRLGEDDDGTIRKTYVRPAWIGPEAWEHAGRQYSLLRAPSEASAIKPGP